MNFITFCCYQLSCDWLANFAIFAYDWLTNFITFPCDKLTNYWYFSKIDQWISLFFFSMTDLWISIFLWHIDEIHIFFLVPDRLKFFVTFLCKWLTNFTFPRNWLMNFLIFSGDWLIKFTILCAWILWSCSATRWRISLYLLLPIGKFRDIFLWHIDELPISFPEIR